MEVPTNKWKSNDDQRSDSYKRVCSVLFIVSTWRELFDRSAFQVKIKPHNFCVNTL